MPSITSVVLCIVLMIRCGAPVGATRDARVAAGEPVRDGSWVLTFEDDFNGTALDLSKWSPRNNESHCSPCELQLYKSERLAVVDGSLVITTQRDHVVGPGPNGPQVYNFSSGWVDTQHSFAQLYGRFEARMQLPARNATGVWPALWTLPNSSQCWPLGGEIDVFEYVANPVLDQARDRGVRARRRAARGFVR